ncbi:uncharacterized protein DDB_G0284459-like [Littorina saxatilis]|uniref:Uncharacterized protein n=1 Tax=Littorina saxatilis TaxID=31220 RepID=A0AAN9GE94_9CAEN
MRTQGGVTCCYVVVVLLLGSLAIQPADSIRYSKRHRNRDDRGTVRGNQKGVHKSHPPIPPLPRTLKMPDDLPWYLPDAHYSGLTDDKTRSPRKDVLEASDDLFPPPHSRSLPGDDLHEDSGSPPSDDHRTRPLSEHFPEASDDVFPLPDSPSLPGDGGHRQAGPFSPLEEDGLVRPRPGHRRKWSAPDTPSWAARQRPRRKFPPERLLRLVTREGKRRHTRRRILRQLEANPYDFRSQFSETKPNHKPVVDKDVVQSEPKGLDAETKPNHKPVVDKDESDVAFSEWAKAEVKHFKVMTRCAVKWARKNGWAKKRATKTVDQDTRKKNKGYQDKRAKLPDKDLNKDHQEGPPCDELDPFLDKKQATSFFSPLVYGTKNGNQGKWAKKPATDLNTAQREKKIGNQDKGAKKPARELDTVDRDKEEKKGKQDHQGARALRKMKRINRRMRRVRNRKRLGFARRIQTWRKTRPRKIPPPRRHVAVPKRVHPFTPFHRRHLGRMRRRRKFHKRLRFAHVSTSRPPGIGRSNLKGTTPASTNATISPPVDSRHAANPETSTPPLLANISTSSEKRTPANVNKDTNSSGVADTPDRKKGHDLDPVPDRTVYLGSVQGKVIKTHKLDFWGSDNGQEADTNDPPVFVRVQYKDSAELDPDGLEVADGKVTETQKLDPQGTTDGQETGHKDHPHPFAFQADLSLRKRRSTEDDGDDDNINSSSEGVGDNRRNRRRNSQRRRTNRQGRRQQRRRQENISSENNDDVDDDANNNTPVTARRAPQRGRRYRNRQRVDINDTDENDDDNDDDDDDDDDDDNNDDNGDSGLGFVQIVSHRSSNNRQRGGSYHQRQREERRKQRRRNRNNRRRRPQQRQQIDQTAPNDSDDEDDSDDGRSSSRDQHARLPQIQTISVHNDHGNNGDDSSDAEAHIRSPFINHRTAYDFLSSQAMPSSRSRVHGSRPDNEQRLEQWQFSHTMSESLCEVFDKHFVRSNLGGRCE